METARPNTLLHESFALSDLKVFDCVVGGSHEEVVQESVAVAERRGLFESSVGFQRHGFGSSNTAVITGHW